MSGLKIKRIVTGVNDQGLSCVALQDFPGPHFEPVPGLKFYDIWESHFPYVASNEPGDTTKRPYRVAENKGEAIMKLVRWPCEKDIKDFPGLSEKIFDHVGGEYSTDESMSSDVMHLTPTIDFIYCIKGKIDCILEDETVTLDEGTFFVQRETNHGWKNPYDEECYLLCVMINKY